VFKDILSSAKSNPEAESEHDESGVCMQLQVGLGPLSGIACPLAQSLGASGQAIFFLYCVTVNVAFCLLELELEPATSDSGLQCDSTAPLRLCVTGTVSVPVCQ
jgi:hypothetical protein